MVAHLHGETERTAKVTNKDKFKQIMNSGVDPSPTLTQEDRKLCWYLSFGNSLRNKYLLAFWKSSQHEGRQVSVFAKQ